MSLLLDILYVVEAIKIIEISTCALQEISHMRVYMVGVTGVFLFSFLDFASSSFIYALHA